MLELAEIGPGPFAGMLLADMGADVVRVDRPERLGQPARALTMRGSRSVAVDLKHRSGAEVVLGLVEGSDVLIESFRPGVMERLGIGPDECLARNPRLVYGRMTGWGQSGPLSHAAGHDINYVALAGALEGIGRAGSPPTPPLNLVGDFGGGGLLLAFGVVCALREVSRTDVGQVVDAAMVDGAALLMTAHFDPELAGRRGPRGTNLLDSGAPFYDVYETSDEEYVAVGAIEPKFYAELLQRAGLDGGLLASQGDMESWPRAKETVAAAFRGRTREEWCALLEGTDACFAPVLSPDEAPAHPHNAARGTFTVVDGVVQPAPAPRFSRTPGAIRRPPPRAGADTLEVLEESGFSSEQREELLRSGAVAQAARPSSSQGEPHGPTSHYR